MDSIHSSNVNTASYMAHMWKNQEYFELSENSGTPDNSPASIKFEDDIRIIMDKRVIIADQNNTKIMYDASLLDLEELEIEMCAIASNYINQDAIGKDKYLKRYMETLRFKLADRRVEFVNASFFNPGLDRSQILLELYQHEVEFGFAKVQLINSYMEVYEHTKDPVESEKLAQIMVDIQKLRPQIDFDAPYFSKSYKLQSKALESQGKVLKTALVYQIKEHRSWLSRHYLKVHHTILNYDSGDQFDTGIDFAGTAENHSDGIDYSKFVDSPLNTGLPKCMADGSEQVTMHQSGIPVYMTEFVPFVKFSELYDIAKYCREDIHASLDYLFENEPSSSGAIECIVWKAVAMIWKSMSEQNFVTNKKPKKVKQCLDNDLWFENPLLPDIILAEHYNADEILRSEDAQRQVQSSLSAYHIFNDPGYQKTACRLLTRLMKLMTLRKRIHLTWIDSEMSRQVYQSQITTMDIPRKGYFGRLGHIKFGQLDFMDPHNIEDEEFEDSDDEGSDHEEDPFRNEFAFEADLFVPMNFGLLAMSEIDPTIAVCTFDALNDVLNGMKSLHIQRFSTILNVQMAERTFFVSATNLNCVVMSELHHKMLAEGHVSISKVYIDNCTHQLNSEKPVFL
jgi:hypothetical protein